MSTDQLKVNVLEMAMGYQEQLKAALEEVNKQALEVVNIKKGKIGSQSIVKDMFASLRGHKSWPYDIEEDQVKRSLSPHEKTEYNNKNLKGAFEIAAMRDIYEYNIKSETQDKLLEALSAFNSSIFVLLAGDPSRSLDAEEYNELFQSNKKSSGRPRMYDAVLWAEYHTQEKRDGEGFFMLPKRLHSAYISPSRLQLRDEMKSSDNNTSILKL